MPLPVVESTTAPPIEPTSAARPRTAFAAAATAAAAAAAALPWDRPGIGWPLTALAVAVAIVVAVRSGPRDADRAWSGRALLRTGWAVTVMLLLAVGSVRAAAWLFALCVLTAGVVGCLALSDRWSVRGMPQAPRVIGSLPAAVRRLVGGIPARGHDRVTVVRTMAAVLVTVALLAVFGFLLTGADAAFAQILSTVIHSFDLATLTRWTGSAAAAFSVVAVVAHRLLTNTTPVDEKATYGRVRRVEWALPVGGLVALLAAFVAVQATVLFGGGQHVLDTAGLTYAEYARSGFWQLLVLTALTLVVVGVAARIAPRSAIADRVLLRTLLGLLSGLALVIVASALSRMAAYEQAYGFTRQRLLVTACELWLGAVFLIIIAAGIRLRGGWVLQAAVAAAVAALLGLAMLNPDAFIARQNVARFAATGRIDVGYLRTLSADAVAALETLPAPYRSCALTVVDDELADDGPDAWYAWNLGRSAARVQLRYLPPAAFSCPP